MRILNALADFGADQAPLEGVLKHVPGGRTASASIHTVDWLLAVVGILSQGTIVSTSSCLRLSLASASLAVQS